MNELRKKAAWSSRIQKKAQHALTELGDMPRLRKSVVSMYGYRGEADSRIQATSYQQTPQQRQRKTIELYEIVNCEGKKRRLDE